MLFSSPTNNFQVLHLIVTKTHLFPYTSVVNWIGKQIKDKVKKTTTTGRRRTSWLKTNMNEELNSDLS